MTNRGRNGDRYEEGYEDGYNQGRYDKVATLDAPAVARVEAMLTTLVDSGDLTPMGQRQITKLWEAGQ